MGTKKCCKCKLLKMPEDFSKNKWSGDGLQTCCKQCAKTNSREHGAKNASLFKGGLALSPSTKTCSRCHVQRASGDFTQCIANKDGLERICKICQKEYRDQPKVKEHRNQKAKQRRGTDLNYKLTAYLRSRINKVIKRNQKAGSAVTDLGCSVDFLKEYIEARFLPGMSWSNWGPKGWHVDHVTSLACFNLANREQFLTACHYTNLQPLWWEENLHKGADIVF
jgi:hypothetical protein